MRGFHTIHLPHFQNCSARSALVSACEKLIPQHRDYDSTYFSIRCVDAVDFLGPRGSLKEIAATCVADWARIGAPGAR
jgi:hypothetical protein